MELNKIYHEPCLETIRKMPDNFLDCVITSPPYWQLRDYGYTGQWGLEPTFQEYLEHLWEMMDGIYRVLKKTGTVWINLGDTYGTVSNNMTSGNIVENKIKYTGGINGYTKPKGFTKSLLLLPHRFAIGCMERGWIVRNDIIWAKRNAMPESVTDRFSKKHEYFFLMTKSEKYYFDLDGIRDKQKAVSIKRYEYDFTGQEGGQSANFRGLRMRDKSKEGYAKAFLSPIGGGARPEYHPNGKNPGSVSDFWDICTKPSSDSHYAQYNDELLKKPVIAGCPEFVCNKCGKPREKIIENTPMVIKRSNRREEMGQSNGTAASGTMVSLAENKVIGWTDCGCNQGFSGGVIFDPFMGSGTTASVALRANRQFIGSEMSEEYLKISEKGLKRQLTQTKLF